MLGRHLVKHKFNGTLMIAIGIAMVIAFGEWLLLMLISLASWAIAYVMLLVVNIPVIYWLIGIYRRTNCYTMDELFCELVASDDLEDENETLLESLD